MGRTSKWFRSLLSSKKSHPEAAETPPPASEKKKSYRAVSKSANSSDYLKNVEDTSSSPYVEGLDANKHAIAVAAATAAVAEAALAAAQAAAEVVRLTSGSSSGRSVAVYANAERLRAAAAVKIQSVFRAYLARRALRALKGLVKLQALVRGHIVRKQSADMLRRMQAMARIQARASAHRAYGPEPFKAQIKFSKPRHSATIDVNKYQHRWNSVRNGGSTLEHNNTRPRISSRLNKESRSHVASNWLDHWMEQCTWNNGPDTALEAGRGDDERSDKILEIDTWKPHRHTRRSDKTPPSQTYSTWNDMEHNQYPKPGSPSRLSANLQKSNHGVSSKEVSSILLAEGKQVPAWRVENGPRLHSVSPRVPGDVRGPFTPTRSQYSRSVFGDYLGHPNYMSNTESSRAKARCHSAPKQRMQLEELSLSADFSGNVWDFDTNSEKGFPFPSSCRSNNSYVYSGTMKRQGAPARDSTTGGFSSAYGRRV